MAVIAVAGAVASAVVALVVGLRSARAADRSATAADDARKELETRSSREEIMRLLRWAAELGVSGDKLKSPLGVNLLDELDKSKILDATWQPFVEATLLAVVSPAAKKVDELLATAGPP